MSIYIANGTVVLESGPVVTDLIIEGETIASIGVSPEKRATANKVINAEGCFVLPGAIDVHTHLDWNFAENKTSDDFTSGSQAAAVGGVTSIINFTNRREGQSLYGDLLEWKERAKPCNVDYGFHVIVNDYNDPMLDDLPRLKEEGVNSIKLFMAYKNVFQVDDGVMYQIMKAAAKLGLVVCIHAENGDVIDRLILEHIRNGNTSPVYHSLSRPPELEAEAVHRAALIAEMTGATVYIVHVSSALAMEAVRQAQRRGVSVYAETCPQYLALDITDLQRPGLEGSKYVCSPPLREKWNQNKLWDAVKDGVISTLGSDHSPFHYAEKAEGAKIDFSKIPNGVPVIEEQYSVAFHHGVLEGRIDITAFSRFTSTNPAKIFGLYPKKGVITVGSDADLVVLNPNKQRRFSKETQVHRTDYNAFEGKEVSCVVEYVMSRGEVIAESGKYVGGEGRGKYVPRVQPQSIYAR